MADGRATAHGDPVLAASHRPDLRGSRPSPGESVVLIAAACAIGGLVGAFAGQLAGSGAVGGGAAALGALSAAAGACAIAIGLRVLGFFRSGEREELLAAANPTHPLMRRMLAEAPGTYVHSAAVANLAEAGAEAVGADQLLARVGAYYHDVGKLREPCFFFENLEEDANPHEHAHPARSAEIIMSHVTEGVELGREYGLPPSVLQIIRDHHGTSLVRYFYHRATQEDASTYEADFRYRGEIPGSREAAIVMLADASEASVRAMAVPEAQRIETSVRGVFDDRRSDGQLERSGLSEEDLERLVGVFVRQLVSFRHIRCAYPVAERKGA